MPDEFDNLTTASDGSNPQPPAKPYAATMSQWAQYNLADSRYNAAMAAGADAPPDPDPIPTAGPAANQPGKPYISSRDPKDITGMADGNGYVSSGPDAGSHQCVALVKAAVPGLGPTSGWTKGPDIAGPKDPNLQPGTAIGYGWDSNGNWPNKATGNHAAIVHKVDDDGTVHVIDQYDHSATGGKSQQATSRSLNPGEEKRYSIITRKR